MPIVGALAALPGHRGVPGTAGRSFVFEAGSAHVEARLAPGATFEVSLATVDVDGLRLGLRSRRRTVLQSVGEPGLVWDLERGDQARVQRDWRDDRGDLHHLDPADLIAPRTAVRLGLHFERDVELEVDEADAGLAAIWLDAACREAVVGALWLDSRRDWLGEPIVSVLGCGFEVGAGEVLVRCTTIPGPTAALRAIVAGGVVATRPQRMARLIAAVTGPLGGRPTADRWAVDGSFAVRFADHPASAELACAIGAPDAAEPGRALATRLVARRLVAGDERWYLAAPGLPRAQRPRLGRGLERVELAGALREHRAEASAPDRLRARVARHAPLIARAAPAVLAAHRDRVSVWWSGLELSAERLGAAVELLARLAVERADEGRGPYR